MITVLDLDAAEVMVQARLHGWEVEFQAGFNRPLEMALVMREYGEMTPEERAALAAGDPELCELCERRAAQVAAGDQGPGQPEQMTMAAMPKGFEYDE